MLNRKRLTVLTAVFAIALIASPAAAHKHFWDHDDDLIEGSGDLETRSMDLKTFEQIELEGAMDIEVSFGGSQEVEVTLDDNLFDNLELEVKGKVLYIGWDESCSPSETFMRVTLKTLKHVKIEGAGDITIKDMDADLFEYDLYGAGDLEIDGKVDELDITLNGAGSIDARELKAKHVKTRLNGVGGIEVTASESIDARVNGVGEISYWGKPDREKTRVGGLGEINRK